MTKRTSNVLWFWVTSILISFTLPVVGYKIGKAGDCSPGQIDGQCGLSTFVWFAYGVIGAVVIAVCCTAYLIIALLKQRSASSAGSQVQGS